MKFCRFAMRDTSSPGSDPPPYGVIEGDSILEIAGVPWGPWSRGSRSVRLADARLFAPVAPSKIVCVGRNYAAHAAEFGNELPKGAYNLTDSSDPNYFYGASYFIGSLDDIRFYNTALTDAEVLSIYTNEKSL